MLESVDFFDIHYHAEPDLYKRYCSAIGAGRLYKQFKGAVVLKSHIGSTAAVASSAQAEGLPVFGSLVLNDIAGGLDYRAILRALAEYQVPSGIKLLVHFPTITGRNHHSKLVRKLACSTLGGAIMSPTTLFNENNKLKPEVYDILKLSADYPIVLSSGHASKEEVFSLIEACDQYGVSKLLLNQPANPMTGLFSHELKELASYDFVWFEQTVLTVLLKYQPMSDFIEVLRDLPRVIYSSDLGQTTQMNVDEWLDISRHWFKEYQISDSRRKEICKSNPLMLLS